MFLLCTVQPCNSPLEYFNCSVLFTHTKEDVSDDIATACTTRGDQSSYLWVTLARSAPVYIAWHNKREGILPVTLGLSGWPNDHTRYSYITYSTAKLQSGAEKVN